MRVLSLIFLVMSLSLHTYAKTVKVEILTNLGAIEAELYPDKAPKTVANFLSYVDKKFYDGLIFHRVIKGFMIQGGGFDKNFEKKSTSSPIKNEANNGLKNDVGTLAMARTSAINSAASQFFINVKDNDFLNYQSPSQFGYAVFGKVVKGMPVVKKIEMTKTTTQKGYQDVPEETVVIKSIKRK